MPKQPREYQQQAIELGIERNALIIDDAGLGKTLTGVEIAYALEVQLCTTPETWCPTLFVCRKTARDRWIEETNSQFPDKRIRILELSPAPNIDLLRDTTAWIVTHYEAVIRHYKLLKQLMWNAIVLDEAHRIKNREADRTVALKQLRARRRVALTGTPLDKSPAELWSVLHFLYPQQYRAYHGFVAVHANRERQQIWVKGQLREFDKLLPGAKDPEALAEELKPYTLRRTKTDVAPELPPKIEQVITIDMDPRQATAYRKLQNNRDILLDLSEYTKPNELPQQIVANVLARMTKEQQLAVDPSLLGLDLAAPKLQYVLDFVEDNPDETLLVLCRFRDTAARLATKLHAARVYGSIQDDLSKRPKRIVGTIAKAGESLNLGYINTTIFVDSVWSAPDMEQASNRTHRLDITEPKYIIYLQCRDTVDESIHQAVRDKWSQNDLVWNYLKSLQSKTSLTLAHS